MSASPANVFSGCANAMPAQIRKTIPASAYSQRRRSAMNATASCSAPKTTNMQPTMIPIVFTDAVSNWRIASAAVTQRIPVTSHSHQNGRTARARTSTSGGWAMVSCTVASFTRACGAARASACVRMGCAHPPPHTMRRVSEGARQRNPVTRAFRILGWMAGAEGDGWPLGEIAAGVGMHPATVHRVLGQLIEDGLVRQVPGTGAYGLGLEFLRL